MLNKYEELGFILKNLVEEKEAFETSIAVKDGIIAEKDRIIGARDQLIEEKDQTIREKDEKINTLESRLHELQVRNLFLILFVLCMNI